MKAKDYVMDIVGSQEYDIDRNNIYKIIVLAYWIGRESACKETCDGYNKILAEQIERAKNCRYYKMAEHVQGGIDHIYYPDYSQDMTEIFGNDEFCEEELKTIKELLSEEFR